MWFLLALITALFWGGSDLFSKMGTDPRDKYSHLRMLIMVGTVMGIHATAMLLLNHETFDPRSMVRYLPVSAFYIVSMAIGYIGLRYLELSVSSPVCNSSGALAALLCFLFLGQTMTWVQFAAVALVMLGVVLLSVFDLKDENKARRFRGEVIEEKYRVSALAVAIPVFYCILDALGTFGDALVMDTLELVSEEEAEIAYEYTFLLCAVAAFGLLVGVKKQKFRLWDEREKGLGALCETAGQFFYVYAISENAIMAAPLISSYCLFSVVLSRVFLREKLTWRQYGAIAVSVCGIVILGFFDAG